MTITRFFRIFFVIGFCCFVVACSRSQPQLPPLKPGETILAFGDSLTYGTGAPGDDSYPAVLQKLTNHPVVNDGVPGQETSDGIERLPEALNRFQPALVILCMGGNDMLHKRSAASIQKNLADMIRLIQTNHISVILVGVPQPSLMASVPDFYFNLADTFKIPLDADSLPYLLKHPKYKSDPIHLNVAGYQVLAENIFSLLKQTGAI